MTLSKKSWHYKIFRLTFPYKKDFKSLCPYFYHLVFSIAIFLLIGWWYLLAAILITISNLADPSDEMDFADDGFFSAQFFAASCIMNIISYIIISTVMMFVWHFSKNTPNTWIIGFTFLIAIILAAIIYIVTEWYHIYKHNEILKNHPIIDTVKPNIPRKPNILVEFVKAKYKKYCPPITWKD